MWWGLGTPGTGMIEKLHNSVLKTTHITMKERYIDVPYVNMIRTVHHNYVLRTALTYSLTTH